MRPILPAERMNAGAQKVEYGSYFSMWKPRLALKLWAGWPTYPMVFNKGILIGGNSDLERFLKG
jgi:monothiol glutaredoxin